MTKFYVPSFDDSRLFYTVSSLTENGFEECKTPDTADFILLGVNPKKELLEFSKPIFAGNVKGYNINDYTKGEAFKIKNAFLTAEGAVESAIKNSNDSLINSSILITGYGRIAKALIKYLSPFTNNITVFARKSEDREHIKMNGFKAVDIGGLSDLSDYRFIFNTVPHPLFNSNELKTVNSNTVLIELASFPGGVDTHFAKAYSVNLIIERGLPAKASPKAAGKAVAEEIMKMITEVVV